jgi:hypothetical protein
MSGHTPGPWNVQPDSPLFAKIGSTGNGGIYVAKAQGPDTLANARLIAAAPELLAALRDLMAIETADVDMDEFPDNESVGAFQDEDGQVKDLPLTFGHLRRARAAIAKATAA